MAIYHFSAQVISRSQGRSSVAAAAYRAGIALYDERQGVMHNYQHKTDVLRTVLLLPTDAPEIFEDRETLWNTVEHDEPRKDSQLAREINIALPRELSHEANWDLLTAFVQTTFVDAGMIADVAFHQGRLDDGLEQPHGHVMLTLRPVDAQGLNGFGMKERAWNKKVLLEQWREAWAHTCNRALSLAGLDQQIDHRTLEAQGVNLEPQTRIGPVAAPIAFDRQAEHDALAARNGERLLVDPDIAWTALTHQQSTFTHRDIARFVHRHSTGRDQFQAVYATLVNHPALVSVGVDDNHQQRFTTTAHLALETQMVTHAMALAGQKSHGLDENAVQAAIADKGLSEEQTHAVHHLTHGGDAVCLVGLAGTGKSYLLGAAKGAWEAADYRVQGVALSGIAAQTLHTSAGIPSRTLASALWWWHSDKERLTVRDVVVLDEAGMVGSRHMAQLMAAVHTAGAKVVLVGDSEQLQPIEAGGAFRALAEGMGFVEVSAVRRQQIPWQQTATAAFAKADTAAGLLAYEAHNHIHRYATDNEAMAGLIRGWAQGRVWAPDETALILAYTRKAVLHLNEQARAIRQIEGELGESMAVMTSRGEREIAVDERLLFLRNDRTLGVKNGTMGVVQSVTPQVLTVRVDGEAARTVTVPLGDYHDVDYGYATTVHKAQGVTVDRTYLLASRYFDRHITYVAMTRHRQQAEVYYSREAFASFAQMQSVLGRAQSKDVSVDYGVQRGFECAEARQLVAKEAVGESQSPYSLDLTEDRLVQAEARLAQRLHDNVLAQDIRTFEKETGFRVNTNPREGEGGSYWGERTLAGTRYAVSVCDAHTAGESHGPAVNPEARLIPYEAMTSYQTGKQVVFEAHTADDGQRILKGMQPDVSEHERQRVLEKTRERGLELDMDRGGRSW